jgi:hypothetical protein
VHHIFRSTGKESKYYTSTGHLEKYQYLSISVAQKCKNKAIVTSNNTLNKITEK